MIENNVISDEMISKGMKATRADGNPFLPSPGGFCQLCLPSPEDYGMPSLNQAFEEARIETNKHAMHRVWSHDAVYLAAASTGFFELKNIKDNDQRYRDTRNRFTEHYERLTAKVMKGDKLRVPPEQRIAPHKAPKRTNQTKAAGDSALNNIMGMLDD